MISRALAALAAAVALASCGAPTPSSADAERALREYIALGVPNPGEPNLFGATVTGAGECRQFRTTFQCPAEVESALDGSIPLLVHLERDGGRWRVESVATTDGWP